nr:MAG TPA: hypothetical protein [Caudoviricetes sp.]
MYMIFSCVSQARLPVFTRLSLFPTKTAYPQPRQY